MKNYMATHVKVQIILFISVGFLALIIAFAAAMTAPFHSPQLAEKAYCQAGETLEVEESTAPSNRPGAKTVFVQCVDAEGTRTSATDRMGSAIPALMGRFFLLAFVVLFVPVSLIGFVITRTVSHARK